MINCKNCGAQIEENVKFCPECGASVIPEAPLEAPVYETPAAAPDLGAAGYSRLVDSEEVQKALKKNKRIGNIAVFVFVLLPLIGFLIYGAVSDQMEFGKAAVYGLIVSAIFAFVALIVAIRRRLDQPFEGVVTDKKKTVSFSDTSNSGTKTRKKYVVRFECDNGKRRKKSVSIPVYEYLQVGDRVRYLPQFPQPFEKYDKRPDGNVMCMFCGRRSPLSETQCPYCHNLLIK